MKRSPAYTVEGAYAEFTEHRKGVLKPGYHGGSGGFVGRYRENGAGRVAQGAAGDDDLRRQGHLSGLTMACGLLAE